MTRDRAKELLPIIKAYSEGKEIEICIMGEWMKLINDPLFDSDATYRIKPTEYNECNLVDSFGNKHYRPFKDYDELKVWFYINKNGISKSVAEELSKITPPSIWVKSKTNSAQLMITGYTVDDECVSCVWLTVSWISLEKLFDDCVFMNNMPCGVEE